MFIHDSVFTGISLFGYSILVLTTIVHNLDLPKIFVEFTFSKTFLIWLDFIILLSMSVFFGQYSRFAPILYIMYKSFILNFWGSYNLELESFPWGYICFHSWYIQGYQWVTLLILTQQWLSTTWRMHTFCVSFFSWLKESRWLTNSK